MGWIEVGESFAQEPRADVAEPTEVATADDVDRVGARSYLELRVLLDGPTVLDDVDDLQLDSVVARSTSFGGVPSRTIEVTRSRLEGCDLSAERFGDVDRSVISGCKLVGTDFSEAQISDVVFERCVLRMVSLRMARLERVSFVDCELTEVDAFELTATDVTFDGSRIERMNIDRMRCERVDLRGVASCSFEAAGRLDGVLVSEEQLPMLSYELAAAVGLSVEATPSDGAT